MAPHPLPRSGGVLRLGVLMALLAGAPLEARAQIFAGTTLPPARTIPAGAADGGGASAVDTTILRPLPPIVDDLTITGENGDLRWPLYVTAAQSAAPLKLQIAFLSAVSILPEASSLAIAVNDTTLATQPIDASQTTKTMTVAIPAGLLKPGANAISVSVRQRHRIDCSVAATYELWTRIDPSRSGLLLPRAVASITRTGDMAAVIPHADGSTPIHILLTGKTNPHHLEKLIRAAQTIALAGRFQQPAVDFDRVSGDPSGVDLVVGTRAALSRLTDLAPELGSKGPRATVLSREGAERPVVLATGDSDAEVDQAIAALASATPASGHPLGQMAEDDAAGRRVAGGETHALKDFGLRSQEFSGRFFHQAFGISLPADMLASDYARSTFDLAGAYAPGLASGAQVRVDVNGRSAGVLKLPYARGDLFRHNQLLMPLHLMRPGYNRIDVYAETPRPEDTTCAASEARRFLFLNSSLLTLPRLAHVLRLPDLAAETAGGLPFAAESAHLVVPKPDRDAMAAALSLTTRTAVAAGRPVPFSFATTFVGHEEGSTLVVAPARALDPDVMRRSGLDPSAVEAAWQGRAATPAPAQGELADRWWVTNGTGPAACRVPAVHERVAATAQARSTKTEPSAKPTPPAAVATDADGEDLLEAWSGESHGPSWGDRLSGLSMKAMAVVDRFGQTLASKLSTVAGSRPASADAGPLSPETSLLVSEGFAGRSGTDVTMIVTAPDSATLRGAVTCLIDPKVWRSLHGRLAGLDASTGKVTAIDATTFRYAQTGGASLQNTRLVVAGWLSLNPIAFVAIALTLAGLLGGTTMMFVRGIGRKSE